MADRTVSVALFAKTGDFNAGMTSAKASAKGLSDELDRTRKTSRDGFREISSGAAMVGGAFALLTGWAINASMQFDKAMSEVQAVTGATSSELRTLREAALEAGKSTVFSATEAARAQAELAKAGLTTAQILGGGLAGALSLAAAGTLSLEEAADVAAKTMNTFNMKASAVGHIADMLAGAANATATDVHEMGEALRMGGLAANAAGMSMDETVVVLGAFADSALVGSDAGTSLKMMLQMLAAPTVKSASLMKELGINVYDAQGNFVGAAKLAEILRTKLGGLTQQQRNAALATIFGADAMRAANVLYGLGAEGLAGYTERINAQADASKTAAVKTDNLAGDVERLKGTLEVLAIEATEGANGGLRFLVQALDSLISGFSNLPGPVQTAITILAGVSGVTLLIVAGAMKIRSTVKDAADALRDMGSAGSAMVKGVSGAMRILGGAGLVAGGVMLLYEGIKSITDLSDLGKPKIVERDVKAMTKALKEFASTGKIIGELASAFGPNLDDLMLDLEKVITGQQRIAELQAGTWGKMDPMVLAEITEATRNAVAQSTEDIAKFDAAMAELVNQGGAPQAAIILNRLRAEMTAAGIPTTDLEGRLVLYNEAARGAAAATTGAAKGFGDAKGNAVLLADGLAAAVQKGQTLIDVFNTLNGAELSLSDAQIKAESTLAGFIDALKESKGSMDITTEAGRKAKGGMNDMARAAAEVAQKTYESALASKGEQGALADAKVAYDGYIKKLRDAMIGAGMQKSKVDELLGSIAKMPNLKTTTVQVKVKVTIHDATGPALTAIENRLSRLQGQAARIGRFADTGIGAKGGSSMQGASAPPPAKKRAAGGPVNMGQEFWAHELGPEPMGATRLMARRHLFVQPAGGGGQATTVVEHRLIIDGTGVLSGLRREILALGGNPQTVLGRG